VNKRKICFITGSRAEYGQLYHLINKVSKSNETELQLIVTGMHLNKEFGYTYKEIEKDFKIDRKIKILSKQDTPNAISKSMSIAHKGFGDAYEFLKPDLIVVLGDRYEVLISCIDAMVARIPIAHIHGGETTEGLIDEAIRHSITKMSHLHFVANKEYKKRVIQLGEIPSNVYNYGGMGVDTIKKTNILSKTEFEKAINFKLNKRNILVTFHPVTLEKNTSKTQFKQILNSINKLFDTNIIFTKSNSDTEGRIINDLIDNYVNLNPHKAIKFESMGNQLYLSALNYIDAVIGNSSSGLAEAPTFKIGTINIGDRQKGRLMTSSIINCEPNEKDIDNAFIKLYSTAFQKKIRNVKNPYGQGGASEKVFKIIKKKNLQSILKKKFFNIDFRI
jgi:GDP/UDP-N,N'-diacetylbacillosamine 2-epimerase (hydrolysing)